VLYQVGATRSALPPAPQHHAAAASAHAVQADTLELSRVWEAGFTGKGVGLAVLDTGLAPHPDAATVP